MTIKLIYKRLIMNLTHFPDEKNSGLLHIKGYSPLVKIIDIADGYALLKNCFTSEYTVCVWTETNQVVMPNHPKKTWIQHDKADIVMRNILNNSNYSKATDDFFAE